MFNENGIDDFLILSNKKYSPIAVYESERWIDNNWKMYYLIAFIMIHYTRVLESETSE